MTQSKRRYLLAAKEMGIDRVQLAMFMAGKYIPQRKQLEFHKAAREADDPEGHYWILFGGARGPGKSHASLAQVGLDDCQRFSGLKWLFLRKIQKAAAESLTDLVRRVFVDTPHEFSISTGTITFPNDSRIVLGGFKDESDIDKYIGIEYDGVVIEEMTQISENRIMLLRGSVRTSREDWRPRIYGTTNPGGVGHLFCKTHFVIPYRKGIEHRLLGGKTHFIPATYRDNRFLDKDYVDYLKALPGNLGKAWRDNDWDVFEGMAFPLWDEEQHVIKPFPIPGHWAKWRTYDWGYSSPFCCLWLAMDVVSGRIYVYRELYGVNLTDREQAKLILEMTPPGENIVATYADPSMWQQNKKHIGIQTSTADTFAEIGVFLTQADNNRLGGKRKVDRVLSYLPDGKPGVQFFDTCVNIIRTLPALPGDPLRPEDVDTGAEDHAYDAFRYGLTNTNIAAQKRQTTESRSPLELATNL